MLSYASTAKHSRDHQPQTAYSIDPFEETPTYYEPPVELQGDCVHIPACLEWLGSAEGNNHTEPDAMQVCPLLDPAL